MAVTSHMSESIQIILWLLLYHVLLCPCFKKKLHVVDVSFTFRFVQQKKKTLKTREQHLTCLLTFESLLLFRFDFPWVCLCLSEKTSRDVLLIIQT